MNHPYSDDYYPPAPGIAIQFGIPDERLSVGPIWAFFDTGADVSIIPLKYIRPLNMPAEDRKYLRSQWGEPRVVDTYFLDIGIENYRFPAVEVAADARGDEIVLGRNILNKLVITLNGPKQTVKLHE